jgi:hypothetical protein
MTNLTEGWLVSFDADNVSSSCSGTNFVFMNCTCSGNLGLPIDGKKAVDDVLKAYVSASGKGKASELVRKMLGDAK